MKADIEDVRIDKLWLSHYMKNYEDYLGPLRNTEVKLLELGIAKGDSLRHWSEWFPKGQIVGLDVNPFKFESGVYDRIHIYQGEQQLYIAPDDCIDCEACIPECPVEAIFTEGNVPAKWTSFIDLNRTRTQELIALGNAGMTEKSREPAGPRCKQ